MVGRRLPVGSVGKKRSRVTERMETYAATISVEWQVMRFKSLYMYSDQ